MTGVKQNMEIGLIGAYLDIAKMHNPNDRDIWLFSTFLLDWYDSYPDAHIC